MHIEYLDPRPFNASQPWNSTTSTGACNDDKLLTTHPRTITVTYTFFSSLLDTTNNITMFSKIQVSTFHSFKMSHSNDTMHSPSSLCEPDKKSFLGFLTVLQSSSYSLLPLCSTMYSPPSLTCIRINTH